MGVQEQVSGRAYLAMLQEQTPTAGNVREYARIVKDRARKRVLIAMAGRTAVVLREREPSPFRHEGLSMAMCVLANALRS